MALDTAQAAKEILEAIGGPGNVVSAAHCATRLRLVIADDSKVDQAKVDDALGAKGNFKASGQLQVIYGTGTVNKVFEEFCKQGNITAASKAEAKEAAAGQQNGFMQAIKVLSDVFVPIIPAIVASGMLMGIMGAIEFMGNAGMIALDTNSVWWRIAGLINACALANLQILLGFSAATVFGGNPYLGASFGALLISGSFINAYGAADAIANGTMITLDVIPGLYSIEWIGYQGHVIPILVGVWILCFFEKRLHKVVPDMFDLFVTPLLSVSLAAYITILFIGPIFVWLENAILGLLTALLSVPLGLGYILIGLIYSPSVVTGLHQMYTTIDVSMLGQYGVTYWLPIASAANIAQGGACLAVALKTRNEKTKALAVPSGISCLLGITEPAIFGVNLPKLKPFIAGIAGAAVGAYICSLTSLAATGTGVTGIFGILLCINQPLQYIIMFAAAFGVAFALTMVLYSEEEAAPVASEPAEAPALEAAPVAAAAAPVAAFVPSVLADLTSDADVLVAPMSGRVLALADIDDPVFSSGSMGGGVAIEPADGKVVSPVDGMVAMLFETKHAIGLVTDDGAEILIHVGMDTVSMGGAPFTAHVSQGEAVTKGQLLMEADLDAIRAAGHPTVTPMIVTNSDEYPELAALNVGKDVEAGAPVASLSGNVPAEPEGITVGAPMTGHVMALSEMDDPGFASGAMGAGVAIEPADGRVVSPVDGMVAMLFETKHAIGLVTDDGVEILIHVGMDTVSMGGAPFTAHVAQGETVTRGQLLMEADLDAIRAAGHPTVTPVIITNTDDFAGVDTFHTGEDVEAGTTVLSITQ